MEGRICDWCRRKFDIGEMFERIGVTKNFGETKWYHAACYEDKQALEKEKE